VKIIIQAGTLCW